MPEERQIPNIEGATCMCCNAPVSARAVFVIQGNNNEQIHTCCAHCGLLHLDEQPASALAKDFLYGRMVDARRAAYLVEPDITLCCIPAVLCFATRDDANRFQQGFNGAIMTFEQALDFVCEGARRSP